MENGVVAIGGSGKREEATQFDRASRRPSEHGIH